MHRPFALAIGLASALICAGLRGCTPSSHNRAADVSATIAPSQPQSAPQWMASPPTDRPQPQAMSLLGKPLYAPTLPPDVLLRRQQQLYEAHADYDRDPHDEAAIIWLGRRQAYLGLYRDAIDTFSNGLAIMPDSYRLLRHRGHRYITVREFDLAIADLSRAAQLVQEVDDEIEPDGQPNARNIPTSTTNTNIYYHLGLAHYLKGEWKPATAAFGTCLDIASNDDMRVAATYWLYLASMRAGDAPAARLLLTTVDADMDVIENMSYLQLLLVFSGSLDAQTLVASTGVADDVTIDRATIGYGLGMRNLLAGENATAQDRFRAVIANSNWAAFGHIAAEAELARMASLAN